MSETTGMRGARSALSALLITIATLTTLAAILVIIRAPTTLVWELEILGREEGPALAVVALLVSLPTIIMFRRVSRVARTAAILAAMSAIVLVYPVASAMRAADRVAPQLASIGDTTPLADQRTPARPMPVVPAELLTGIGVPHITPVTHAISATDGTKLPIDLYEPVHASGAAPVLVALYGGSWRSGTRTDLSEIYRYLADRGYVVAAVTYRHAPAHPFPAALEDIRAAIAYLKRYAVPLGIDPNKIVLMGRSAGGHLAMLTAYDTPDPGIRGVVDLYGPADLRWGYAHPTNPRVLNSTKVLEDFLSGPPGAPGTTYDLASPITHVSATTVPTLMIHGARDELVSPMHAKMLGERLESFHRPHAFLELPWATHGCDYFISGPCGQVATWAIERFLAAVTR